jgi:hypothetical protein
MGLFVDDLIAIYGKGTQSNVCFRQENKYYFLKTEIKSIIMHIVCWTLASVGASAI